MTANAALQDRAIDHAVDLQRYKTGVIRRMMAVLNRADARLMAALSEALLQLPASEFTVERLEALLTSVRAINADAYAAVLRALEPELAGLAEVEAATQTAALRRAVPAVVQLRFPIAAVAWEQVYAAALARPFQGRLLRDWAASLGESRMRIVRETIRAGYVQGETAGAIISKLRGTKALRFDDGALARPRRELAAVVQTALSHTAQTARRELYRANADLVKAVQWVSTLDSKTTHECAIRDGLEYDAETLRPLGHAIPWGDGPGRLHFNCRSVDVPVLKSWRELGIPADELSASTRASMDGQVPGETTFGEWLGRQSPERQDDVLGPVRGGMLRSGTKFEKFYDDKGRFLTLDQLRDRT